MEFIDFNLAKKFEEKGFTLPESEIIGKFDSDGLFHSQLYINFTETMDLDEIIAPTIPQVLEWLRKEKKIFVEISPAYIDITFYVSVYKCKDGKFLRCYISDLKYNSYEVAALAGIEYVLDNLI